MRKLIACAALLALAGCGGSGDNETASAPDIPANDMTAAEPDNQAAPSNPAPAPQPSTDQAETGDASAGPGTTLPPADAAYRYVGRWAADARLCRGGAWLWRERSLDTAGEVSCQFEKVTPVPGGYDIDARCTAEGPEKPDRIKVRFAESARAMLVDATVVRPVGLIYCGPLE